MSDPAEYTKSLEETVRKQESIIEDLFKDRERIIKMLKVLHQNTEDLKKDIELLCEPLNPGPESSMKIIREAIKKKIIEELTKQEYQMQSVGHYTGSDPTEYRVTNIHWVIPIIQKLKGS